MIQRLRDRQRDWWEGQEEVTQVVLSFAFYIFLSVTCISYLL